MFACKQIIEKKPGAPEPKKCILTQSIKEQIDLLINEVHFCTKPISVPSNFWQLDYGDSKIKSRAQIPRTIDHRVMRSRSMVLSVSYRLHGA